MIKGGLELYHGSTTSGIEVLRPHIAHNAASEFNSLYPKVYASTDIDYAIFMAIIGARKLGGWSPKTYGGKGFYVYEEFANFLIAAEDDEVVGTVYALDRVGFEQNNGHEWTSIYPARVLGSLAVGVRDLPEVAVGYDRRLIR